MKPTLLRSSLVALAVALSTGCGNTITNNDGPLGALGGPPVGAEVTVTFVESDTTTSTVVGSLVGIGAHWVGVERAPGAITWMPADRVKLILEDRSGE